MSGKMANLNITRIYEWPLTLRLLVMGLVSVIVLYMLYLWDISSLNNQLQIAQQKEVDIKQQMDATLEKQASLQKELTELHQVEPMLAQWQQKLIPYSKLPQLLNEILKIGANNNVYFDLFTPGAEVQDGVYIKVPIKVIAVGSYHDLATFLSQIANLPTLVVIGNFIITNETKNSATTKSAANGLLTATLSLEVYYLANKKA